MPGKGKDKNAKIPQTIKVCPFLEMSSFEVEPILSEKSQSFYSDVENTPCNEPKFETNPLDHHKQSLPTEDPRGYDFEVSGVLKIEGNEGAAEDKNSGFSAKCVNSYVLSEKNSNREEFTDFQSDLQQENVSDFISNGENCCSLLGISESDFFSSDTAKQVLKKDKEIFEKEQMLETANASEVSNWSVNNDHKVTAPSWMSEQKVHSTRYISIGTFFGARSSDIGSMSDSTRVPNYFGKLDSAQPKAEPSSCQDQFANEPSTDGSPEDSSMKKFQLSSLSELLDEISTTDPAQMASKIVNMLKPSLQRIPKKYTSNHDGLTEKPAFQDSSELNENTGSSLSDIEESEGTLIRSASSNNVSEQTEDHGECKSTTSEPVQSIDNSLNCSVGSSSERGSTKTAKSDTLCVDSMLQFKSVPHEISRSASSFSCHGLQPDLSSIGASNSYQSELSNTLTALPLLTGQPTECFRIETPSEICFPEKFALGDSQEINLTVWNSDSVGCYYKISYISAYLNSSPLPFEMAGLNYSKVVLSSATGNTTDIKLVLAPKYKGKIEINLQIDAFIKNLDPSLNATLVSTARTKIQYDVLQPSIIMMSKGKDTLNIGHVEAGSSLVEYITIINNCEASVPMRISLSNESSENRIAFSIEEIVRQKLPTSGGLRFLSPEVLLYRLPATKDKSLPSSLDIPIVFKSINGRVDSAVTAAIETQTFGEILAFIKITATGGNAKLVLKDPNQNPLILKACKGATCSHSITVINIGRLPVVYDIHIDLDSDALSVSPSSLNLHPNQCATLSVVFTPSTYQDVKRNLQAAAEPHGQVFSITEIIGQVEAHSVKSQLNITQIPPTRPTRDSSGLALESSNLIECDRKYLTWGGVDIGKESGVKTCTIRNPKEVPVHVKLFIKSKFKDFLLIDDAGNKTSVYEVTLRAKEEKLVSVVFIPISVTSYSSYLCIKPVSENGKVFWISLSGYGGTSDLKVLDLPDSEGAGYSLNIDDPHETDEVYKNITFHNVGCRPAFVKLLVTYDGLVQNVVAKQIVIHPSEFVLLEKEKKSILVSINCMNRNLSNNEVVIWIYNGDEIMRQKLRRKLKASSSEKQNVAHKINFNVPYDGEDKVVYDLLHKSSPKDESLFFCNLKRLMINVVNKHTSFSRRSFGSLSEVHESLSNLTLNTTMQSRIKGHSPPTKSSTVRSSLLLPCDEPVLLNVKSKKWTIEPEDLTVDDDDKEKWIVLKSHFDSDLRFKVEYTCDFITVSPVSGILPSRQEAYLRLVCVTESQSELTKDYHANIKILCDSIEKLVNIEILRHKKFRGASPLLPVVVNDSETSGFSGNSFSLATTLQEPLSSVIEIDDMFNFPHCITIQATKYGVLTGMSYNVGNPLKSPTFWRFTPESTVYIEPNNPSMKPIFEFRAPDGCLKPSQEVKISVRFYPETVGYFRQTFKLVVSTTEKKQVCKIKVQGKALGSFSDVFDYKRRKMLHETKSSTSKKS